MRPQITRAFLSVDVRRNLRWKKLRYIRVRAKIERALTDF